MLWCDKLGTYLGHWRLGLFTSILLCLSHTMQKPWAHVVCPYDIVQGLVEILTHDYRKYGRILGNWWYAVVVWIVTMVRSQIKKLLRRAQQNWGGWTHWDIRGGDPLCAASALPLRLSFCFPWIPPLLAIAYPCTPYLPRALHSNRYTVEVWQSLLQLGEAWNRCLGCTTSLVHIHSLTRSFALILTDNENNSFLPAEQMSISSESQDSSAACVGRREVLSSRASSALSQGWSASSSMTHASSGAHSTSEHPFRKAVWTPPTQAGGCQKKPWTSHFGTETASAEYFLILNTARSAVFQQLFY